jgi:hypothetical protein
MLAYNTSKNITTYDAKNTLSKLTKVRKGSNPTTHHYPRSNTCTERNKNTVQKQNHNLLVLKHLGGSRRTTN